MKAATTSVFTYLNAHPQICGSSVKETTFFGKQFTGNIDTDFNTYSNYFKKCPRNADYIMEASTGYLHGGIKVAKRIKTMFPGVKLLFMLRNPTDRLYSYYNHMVSKLVSDFDNTITFNEYVEKCFEHVNNGINLGQSKTNHLHFAALSHGRYATYINEYFQIFPREQIKIMFYEKLNNNPKLFMYRLCDFLEIDKDFYNLYTFSKLNVTFSSKLKFLHTLALTANNKLERYTRRYPGIKRKIVSIYKYFNEEKVKKTVISDKTRASLEEYYKKSNHELANILLGTDVPPWVK